MEYVLMDTNILKIYKLRLIRLVFIFDKQLGWEDPQRETPSRNLQATQGPIGAAATNTWRLFR